MATSTSTIYRIGTGILCVFLNGICAGLAAFRTYYFPGWRAAVDDALTPILVTDPHGQISVEVPAGEHRLTVWFGPTPLRSAATVVSGLSLVALCLAAAASLTGRFRW